MTYIRKGTFLRSLLCMVLALCGTALAKPTILWNSDANMVNLTSDGTPMDGGFKFELGVFSGSFIPTAANTSEWSTYWVPAKSTNYFPNTKRFADDLVVQSNVAPFTSGKAVYIWGLRGNAISGEWILFRADSWKLPLATGFGSLEWFVKDATAVLGEINSSGSPHLMKSVAIVDSMPVPPKETWGHWQAANLAGKEKILPHEDADGDGVPNILEFAFGTDGGNPGPPTQTPVSLSGDHLVITVPRRQDRDVILTVEVSNDLIDWRSGPAYTEVLEDGPAGLVVRDLVAHGAGNPKRFIRLKAEIPTP